MPHLNIGETQGYYFTALAFFFVALNAFFVAAEFALVKVRATHLKVLSKRGHPVAGMAKKMVDHLDAYLSATQLGITLASLGLGWIGEPAFARLLWPVFDWLFPSVSEQTVHSIAFSIAFLVISGLHIILGELVPKSIAIQKAEKVTLILAVPLRIFYLVFFPFLWVLNGMANAFLRLIRFPMTGGPGRAHSEEELKLIVEDSFVGGAIGPRKRVLLDKAMDFSHKRTKDIMVPKDKIVTFDLTRSIHDNLVRAKESGHTRFPVFEKGRVLGFVHMKDIIWSLEHGEVIHVHDMIRPILFFEDDMRLDTALLTFQVKKIHIAVVQRKDLKITGLMTLEDVIEELVGEIEDEFDQAAPKT